MSAVADMAPRRSWWRPLAWTGAALLAIVALLAVLVLDLRPRALPPAPPDALTAERARDLLGRLHTLVVTEARDGRVTASEAEIDAGLASVGRMVPGLSGLSHVGPEGIAIDLSVGAPLVPGPVWLNLHGRLAPSDTGLRLDSLWIGGLPLPPALAQAAARRALDRLLGDGFGSIAMGAVSGVAVAPPEVAVTLDFRGEAGRAFFERLRNRLRSAAGAPDNPRRVHVQLYHLGEDAAAGRLPRRGSALPWLADAVRNAITHREAAPADELRDALFALALYCGDAEFGAAIGARLPERMTGAGNLCANVTLHGRKDLRQHFVMSAAIYAASTRSAVMGVGELKELLDTTGGGTGFSFDDMAANLSGARFAATFLAAPPETWPAMLEALDSEAAILPAVEDLPTQLSAADFAARFGGLDSPDYAAMVAEIERRVAALPLHAGRAGAQP